MYKLPLLAVVVVTGVSTALAGDPAIKTATRTIVIKDFSFTPSNVTIEPGTTVTWVNEDESPHTISEEGRSFRSAALDTNDRFSYTFTQAGDFTYYCTMHPMMVGKVTVKRAGAS